MLCLSSGCWSTASDAQFVGCDPTLASMSACWSSQNIRNTYHAWLFDDDEEIIAESPQENASHEIPLMAACGRHVRNERLRSGNADVHKCPASCLVPPVGVGTSTTQWAEWLQTTLVRCRS